MSTSLTSIVGVAFFVSEMQPEPSCAFSTYIDFKKCLLQITSLSPAFQPRGIFIFIQLYQSSAKSGSLGNLQTRKHVRLLAHDKIEKFAYNYIQILLYTSQIMESTLQIAKSVSL